MLNSEAERLEGATSAAEPALDHRLADEAASDSWWRAFRITPSTCWIRRVHVASWNEGAHRLKGYEAESTACQGSRFHLTLRIAAEGQKHLAR